MTVITEQEAASWLERYGKAWETGDVEGVARLFSEDARYHEKPFDDPVVGHAAIKQYWRDGASEAQEDVRFGFTVWAVSGDQCFSHWRASFNRIKTGGLVQLDGAFRLIFERDAAGGLTCTSLQEWWHRK